MKGVPELRDRFIEDPQATPPNEHYISALAHLDRHGVLGCLLLVMHRISQRQNALLMELRGQANRIEEVSKAEHDLVKAIHPKVESIESGISKVTEAANTGKASAAEVRPRN